MQLGDDHESSHKTAMITSVIANVPVVTISPAIMAVVLQWTCQATRDAT